MGTRIDLTSVKSRLYAWLGIDGGTYGTYVSNARYPSAAIDKAVTDADIYVSKLLIKNGQEPLMHEKSITVSRTSGQAITTDATNNNDVVLSVTDTATGKKMQEITYGEFELMNGSGFTSLVNASGKSYYAIWENCIFLINSAGATVRLFYLDPTTSPLAPVEFEEEVACRAAETLLMKRGDNPAAAGYYGQRFREGMSSWIAMPETASRENTNK